MKSASQQQHSPRKHPVQARSRESVHAIIGATAQILSTRGRVDLTTKAISVRTGLSIGSVYQYFPNKEAIVLLLIVRKAEEVTCSFESAANQQQGRTLLSALCALTSAYFTSKFAELHLSRTLHASLDRSGGAQLLRPFRERMIGAIESVIRGAPDATFRNSRRSAQVIWSAITGAGRSVIEAKMPLQCIVALEKEVLEMISRRSNLCC